MIVSDAGYDVTRLAWVLRDLPVELAGRVRSDRVMRLPLRSGAHLQVREADTWRGWTTPKTQRQGTPLRRRQDRQTPETIEAIGRPGGSW